MCVWTRPATIRSIIISQSRVVAEEARGDDSAAAVACQMILSREDEAKSINISVTNSLILFWDHFKYNHFYADSKTESQSTAYDTIGINV